MKYTRLMLVAYDGEPTGPLPFDEGCFHVELKIDEEDLVWPHFVDKLIKPAANCLFQTMIPPMPHITLGGKVTEKGMSKLMKWETKYFGGPNA